MSAEAILTPRQAAYDAVWNMGLTSDAHLNARIWRSVEAALDAYESALTPHAPTFGADWTCVAHGDACEKSGLDWDCINAPWAVALREEADGVTP